MKIKIETKRNQRWTSFAKLLPALVLAITTAARAETSPAAIPFSDIGTKATADYQGDALGITATADGARLRCGFQKLEGRVTREGLWLESTEPGATAKLRLVATILRREDHSTLNIQPSTPLPATGTVSVTDKLVRFTRPGVTEEYSVSVDGVRQDFVIAARPAGVGDLRVELALNGARAEATADGAKLRLEDSGRELAYNRLRVTDATGRELTACLEVLAADRLAVSIADDGATYPVRIDPTFSDADWISLSPGLAGANNDIRTIAMDDSGNIYLGGDFTVAGAVAANYIAKWDGSAWSALGSGMNSRVCALAVSGTNLYAGGNFTTAGGVPANYIAKWDGNSWSALGSYGNSSVYALAVRGTNLYVGGGAGASGFVNKWDGNTWSQLASGMNGIAYALAVSGTDLYAGGSFSNATWWVQAKRVAKWDGSVWSALGSGMNNTVYALAVNGTNLYVGGGGGAYGYLNKWDGSIWSALGSGLGGGTVYALAVSGTNIYAGSGFIDPYGGGSHGYLNKWDGSTWSALGSEMAYGPVYALAVSVTNIYAGGSFRKAGDVGVNRIAKWDGSTWSALGLGMNSTVYAMAMNGINLYAGGGGGNSGFVNKWDGSTWSALGSGLGGGLVFALAVNGTNLYAGGYFTNAGGLAVNNIARWDGSAWSALGSGVDGIVYALAVSGTNLYAGGYFVSAGGVVANHVAKWNGSVWSALGSGMNHAVYALAVSGTHLYTGGLFTTAGGVPANYIAKWDGDSWSTLLGSYGNGTVYALAVSGTSLYAGGQVNGGWWVAKWDSSTWSFLGLGMSGSIRALAVIGTNLFAGGSFTNVGGVSTKRIAKWDGSTWSALGSGMDGEVLALAADGMGGLLVGGQFLFAGTNVSPCIAQGNLGEWIAILEQPQSQTAGIGDTVEFAAVAAGTHPVKYQWYFDVTNAISGATNAILQLTDVQLSDSGEYTVVVTNVFLAVTSAPAVLTIVAAPIIQSAPTNRTVHLGAAVDFSVSAFGTPPLSYQWYFNGTNAVSGGTNSVLQLTNVQYSDSGTYTMVVTNAYGAVTSPPVTLLVVSPGTVFSCTEAVLREAIASGDRVTFACDGTIGLASTITNETDTVIDGSGHHVTINGWGVRVFYNLNDVSLTLINVTIADSQSQLGGGIYNEGALILNGVQFQNNRACVPQFGSPGAEGGAIYNQGGIVNGTNCGFYGNIAFTLNFNGQLMPKWGGAIRNANGDVSLDHCIFVGNSAEGRSAIAQDDHTRDGEDAAGGAIHNSGTLKMRNCTLLRNLARGGDGAGSSACCGGALWVGGNGGEASGGAIFNGGSLEVDDSMFGDNACRAGSGGDSLARGSGGTGRDARGGAIWSSGSLLIRSSTFATNTATGGRGGRGGVGDSDPSYPPSEYGTRGFPGGAGGSGLGGSIYSQGSAVLVNSTVAANEGRGGDGGGGGSGGSPLYPYIGGQGGAGANGGSGVGGISGYARITNCTIAFNFGFFGAGGSGGQGGAGNPPGNPGSPGTNGSATGGIAGGQILNTILASNSPGGNCSGAIDAGHNLSSDGTCAFSGPGSMNNTDPMLGPLTDNGGPTLTMALLPGSPAIDAGDNTAAPPTDQRGVPRPFGSAADIGAFEFWASPPASPTLQIGRCEGGGIDMLVCEGPIGQSCRLLTSTDLVNWTAIATNLIITTNGTLLFHESSTCEKQRFYRVTILP